MFNMHIYEREDLTPIRKLLLMHVAAGGKLTEYMVTGNPVSFTTDVQKALTECLLSFTPIQSGTGDPSPDNVRPITGWAGAHVYLSHTGTDDQDKQMFSVTLPATGANQFNGVWVQGNIATGVEQPSTTAMRTGFIDVDPSTAYYAYTTRTTKIFLFEYDEDGTYLNIVTNISNGKSFTTSAATKKVRIVDRNSGTETVNTGINYPATVTTYEPYTNTVYGGALDLTTGVLTVTHAMWTKNTADIDTTSADYPGWTQCGIKDIVGSGLNTTITVFSNIGTRVGVNTKNTVDTLFLTKAIYGKTKEEWIALAIDVQVVAELATPLVYQLTPQQIETLIGTNVLWSDTNGDMEVKYLKKG